MTNGGIGTYHPESYQTGYWRAYAQAIRDVDAALQAIGDDRTIRDCRRAVLNLIGIEYHPEWVNDKPTWPSELHGVQLVLT